MIKHFFLNGNSKNEVSPAVCGMNQCQSGDVFPRHYIQRHVLHYVTKGSGKYLLNNEEYQIKKGDIFVSHKGDFTSYISDEKQPLTYIWVSFDCAEPFAKLLSQKVFSAFWATPLFNKMYDCRNSLTPEWVMCATSYDFFTELATHQSNTTIFEEDYVTRACHYIESSYAEQIKIEEIAATLGISRNQFFKVFKQKTGISPQEYLISYRLKKATELLQKKQYPQKEIASRIGYTDVYTFSRMFKKKYGLSPGEYSKQT